MKNLLLLTLFGLASLLGVASARAQGVVTLQNVRVEYQYGQTVTFRAQLSDPPTAQQASIFFQSEGEAYIRNAALNIRPDGQLEYTHSLANGPLRPFTRVNFWYQITQRDGQTITSRPYTFTYSDNRYPWQTLKTPQIRLHWYKGDATFAQNALNSAQTALARLKDSLSEPTGPIELYIYATQADLQSALTPNSPAVLGHASPEQGVALVSIAPGPEQGLLFDRQIPHELAHLLTYQKMGDDYTRIPVWLKEGIASSAELSPDPDYPVALSQAIETNSLLPFSSLCASFPPEMAGTFLAYAQSASFTQFLKQEYGNDGLERLLKAYASGLGCEQGAEQALGLPLSAIETRWRQLTLGENRTLTALQGMAPYLAILLILLIVPLWGLVSPVKKAF